jgi:cell division protein DivIC
MSRVRKSRTGIGIISFFVLIICGIVVYNKMSLEDQRDKAENQITKLEKQLDEEKEREADIKKQEAYRQTPRYIEDVARDKLGLVYEDEIIFKAEEEESDD